MTKIDRHSHARFYEKELDFLESEFKAFWYSKAFSLLLQHKIYVGLYQGFDETRGNIIIKFKKGEIPRLKQPYTLFTLPSELCKPKEWGSRTYKQLRDRQSGSSDGLPIFYLANQDMNYSFIGFAGAEIEFIERLKPNTLIVVGIKDPPYQYLQSLKKIVEQIPANTAAGRILDIAFDSNEWKPISVITKENTATLVLDYLKSNDEIVIQGPPGTGKTYLMSQICDRLLSQNKSIMVTALTNRALIELAEKENLDRWLKDKRVFKTHLTSDEQRRVKSIQLAKEIRASNGYLLLTTFYQMSIAAAELPKEPIFDYLILEEASQSFLTTIAACKILARKVILVGDPMQLQPIYQQPNLEKIHPYIQKVVSGLETFAFNSGAQAYRMIETYRLTPRAAQQTGIFYDNSLISASPVGLPITIKSKYANLFHEEGGTNIHFLDIANEGKSPIKAIKLICGLVDEIHQNHKDWHIAVLAPFVETAKNLQEELFPRFGDLEWLTVETIDRIQGLTCDLTLFLIPYSSTSFAFQINRFNVATSRSRGCTLIIADIKLKEPITASGLVADYWIKTNDATILKREFFSATSSYLFSKTAYLKGLQCEKQVYLYKHHYHWQDPLTPKEKVKFNAGHSFEDKYRAECFPAAFDVEKEANKQRDLYPTLTQDALEKGRESILEATFIYDDVLVMNDVLTRDNGQWEIQEIKNSAVLKEIHIQDIALQYYVTKGVLDSDLSAKLVLPNVKGSYQIVEVSEQVLALQSHIQDNISRLKQVINQQIIPQIPTGEHCNLPYKCSFWGYCHKLPA